MIRRLVVPPGPADPRESRQTEIRLSVARLLLASASLLAISIAPRQTSEYAVSFTFVAAYVPYSLIVLVLLLINKTAAPSQRLQVILTALDIAFSGAISGTQEPNSPFFGFLTFVLVTAAFRWGFLETVATGVLLWMTVQVVTLFSGTHDLYRFILRAAYLTVMSVLLGYLAQWDKRLKAERS